MSQSLRWKITLRIDVERSRSDGRKARRIRVQNACVQGDIVLDARRILVSFHHGTFHIRSGLVQFPVVGEA